MKHVSAHRLLFAALSLGVIPTACSLDPIESSELGCLFRLDFGWGPTTKSDNEVLRAAVSCEPGSDCADRRNIHLGAKLEFTIEIPAELSVNDIEVQGSPAGHFELEGFENLPKECDEGREINGTVTFDNTGTGAFIVMGDGEELDRFTVDVQEPQSLEIQFAAFTSYGEFTSTESLSLEEDGTLRALIRGEDGDRLVGGPAPEWTFDAPDLAQLRDSETNDVGAVSETGASVFIYPQSTGDGTIQISAGEVEATLPFRATLMNAMGGAGGD